jgi:hypothetical protein
MNLKNIFVIETAGKCCLSLFLTLAVTGPAFGQSASHEDALLQTPLIPANRIFHGFPDPGTVEPGQLAKPLT